MGKNYKEYLKGLITEKDKQKARFYTVKGWNILCIGLFFWAIIGSPFSFFKFIVSALPDTSLFQIPLLIMLVVGSWGIAMGFFFVLQFISDMWSFIFSAKKDKVSTSDKQKIENPTYDHSKVPSKTVSSNTVHSEGLLKPEKTSDIQSTPTSLETFQSTSLPVEQAMTPASDLFIDEQKVSTEDEKERLPVPRKVDWDSVQKARKQTGDFGEMLVVEYEKAVLLKSGKSDLSIKVELVASKNLGYDVLSKFADGSNKYIEVKAFTGSKAHNFVVTRNELDFLKENPDSTYVYMVINCDTEPEILMTSARQFFKLNLKPSVFKITL